MKGRLDTLSHTSRERLPPCKMLTDADACLRAISTRRLMPLSAAWYGTA